MAKHLLATLPSLKVIAADRPAQSASADLTGCCRPTFSSQSCLDFELVPPCLRGSLEDSIMVGISRARTPVIQRVFLAAMIVLFATVMAHANSVSITSHHREAASSRVGVMGPFSLAASDLTFVNRQAVTGTLSFTGDDFMTGSKNLHDIGLTIGATGGSILYHGRFRRSYFGDTGSVSMIMTPVAEPGSLVLMGTALLGLAFVARRKLIARNRARKDLIKSSMTWSKGSDSGHRDDGDGRRCRHTVPENCAS